VSSLNTTLSQFRLSVKES